MVMSGTSSRCTTSARRGGRARPLCILLCTGLACSLAAARQEKEQEPPPIEQPVPGRPALPPPKQPETPEQRRAREALEARNKRVQMENDMRARALEGISPMEAAVPAAMPVNPAFQRPGMIVPPAPGGLQPDDQPIPEGALEHLEGDGLIRLNFGAESITLDAFIDYVSQVLRINIWPDPSVSQQQIMFRAPIEIPKDRLLPLVAAIVEDKGFALVEDPLLGYFIRSAGTVPVAFDGDLFQTTRVIRTPMIRPSAVQSSLQPLMGQSQSQLRYSPMDDLGVLIVTGPPRAVEMVEQFVDRLLDEIAGQRLKRFQLQYVEANFARSRVLTLNGKLGGAVVAAPAQGAPAMGGGGALANLESRLIVDQGNSLIFRGSEEEFTQISDLIAMVDVVTPLISRRYGAGPVAMQIANAGQREGLGPVSETGGGAAGQSVQRSGMLGAATGSSTVALEVNTSGFAVDTLSGSVVYTGTESQHKRVAELVKTFTDQIVGSRVDVRSYKLHNAEAESVANLLTQLIQDESQQSGGGTSPFLPASRVQGSRSQRTARAATEPVVEGEAAADGEAGIGVSSAPVEISIVPDTERNQIFVKAPARQQAEIEQIIRTLDERRPQVYIEAQIVAVSTNNDFNWTVETQINAGQFLLFTNFGLSTVGTAPPGGQAAQGVRNVGTGNSGLTTAVIKSDYVPFILNTLASKTDSRIISNPRILVNDNETADLRSEREEPFATTTQGTATTTTGQGGVATAGTSLSVTPRISKGGYISLEYQIELSDFVGAPVAGLQPPTQREQFTSMVTIPSDSTIIVGGFTLTRRSETDSGIPILKDIPVIGMLFKSLNITDRRSTIFVFITPRIMTDPNFIDLRLASEGPAKRSMVEGITPELKPITIRIDESRGAQSRLVPENEAPSGP